MGDSEWGGAENDALFDTMLKSILKPQPDLQKNWDVNLIKLCDRFLQKLQRAVHEGCSYVDFVEAAMVVQSSAVVYAKKVDYLWVLLEKLLVTFRSSPAEDPEEEPNRTGQEGPRRVRRSVRNLDGEDFSDVVLDPGGRNINLRPGRDDAMEEYEEADYFIQDLMNNKEMGPSIPLYDVHEEMIGNMHDFRMNRRLVDGTWLADTLPVFELRGLQNRQSSPCGSTQREIEDQPLPLLTDIDPCEPAPEPLQEPAEVEEQEQPFSSDQCPSTPLPPLPPSTPPPLSPGEVSDTEVSRSAMTRSACRSARVVNITKNSKDSEDERTNRCKTDIPDKPLEVHLCTRPECVYCGERHERKRRKRCCKSEDEIQSCLSGIEAMLLDDVIKPELTKLGGFQFSRDFLLGLRKSQIRAIQEVSCFSDWTNCDLSEVKSIFEDDEVEADFHGFDFNLCDELLRLNPIQVQPQNTDVIAEDDELDSEEVSANQCEPDFQESPGEVPLPVDITCDEDAINTMLAVPPSEPERQPHAWQPDAIVPGADEMEARAARVMAWHDSLRPLLEGAEERNHVDIHEYGSRLLAAFPPGCKHSRLSFQQVMQGKPREDTCRYFLAALMLANTRNIDISKNSDSELAMDCMELTLLDRSLQHELMEEECAAITTSDRSRKRKRVAPAAGRGPPPQNSQLETPLRESPNRINIMSSGGCLNRTRPALSQPGTSKCFGEPQPGPSWARDPGDWASDTSDSVDLSDVRTLGTRRGKRRKL